MTTIATTTSSSSSLATAPLATTTTSSAPLATTTTSSAPLATTAMVPNPINTQALASTVSSTVVPIAAAKITRRRTTRLMKVTNHFNFSNENCALCGNAFRSTNNIVVCDQCRRQL